MQKIRRSEERGQRNYGWLDARYTFSFGEYFDPAHVQFGNLRVLNQDRVERGRGFPTHGHRDMEIVTYVLDGLLEHKDSMGHGSEIRPGDVQLMSAGTGVTHSEYNGSADEPLHLLQMWVLPRTGGTEPRYEQKHFPRAERQGALKLVVSPDGADGSLTIGQDARMYLGLFDAGERATLELTPNQQAWIHVARGRLRVGNVELGPGDGLGISDEPTLTLEGLAPAELILWQLDP